ncbi:hypothetical protein H0G86_006137 [Trichoderma simmonsii]|uniref:Uncharacterized protein n=1 Tax=Trichoderma simmonsii TaxID=1491479 RepID=A0A8G0PFT8_9HYPO|nr:hypothetical protein H0G86_006137 [Trichoderma simmonsii]
MFRYQSRPPTPAPSPRQFRAIFPALEPAKLLRTPCPGQHYGEHAPVRLKIETPVFLLSCQPTGKKKHRLIPTPPVFAARPIGPHRSRYNSSLSFTLFIPPRRPLPCRHTVTSFATLPAAVVPKIPRLSNPSPQEAIASSSDVAVDVTRSIGLLPGSHAAESRFISMMVVAVGNSRR